MTKQTIAVLDFGGQYKDLIARRVREQHVYSVVLPGDCGIERIKQVDPIGLILTGGPRSVNEPGAPLCGRELFELGIPVLGICYGFQLMSHVLGGSVSHCTTSEYGVTQVEICGGSLVGGENVNIGALMSHTDYVSRLPDGFKNVAHTADCPIAAAEDPARLLYGVQFHPEVEISERGYDILHAFLYDICGASGDYSMRDYIEAEIEAVRQKVGDRRVILALSGGVDSSVCAALLSKAIPGQLTCIFVDHGCMRKNEPDEIESVFSKRDLTFVRVNAADRFLDRLAGVTDPERKRKIIGEEFIRVFEDESRRLGSGDCFLAQGTIYPDIIESGGNNTATIKSHHNVGGLPHDIGFVGLVEPLSRLFKDEVRAVGRELSLPDFLVNRQPFPGPGLSIRCIGEVTREKLEILRNADAIVRDEIGRCGVPVSQYFAVLTDLRSVGVMGDERTYDYTVAVRAVVTSDFMTCEYARLPHETLALISQRITNEVKGVNRVVYDISNKPPATIEWE